MNDCGAHKIAVKQLLGGREQKIQHYCPVATMCKQESGEGNIKVLHFYGTVQIMSDHVNKKEFTATQHS